MLPRLGFDRVMNEIEGRTNANPVSGKE